MSCYIVRCKSWASNAGEYDNKTELSPFLNLCKAPFTLAFKPFTLALKPLETTGESFIKYFALYVLVVKVANLVQARKVTNGN